MHWGFMQKSQKWALLLLPGNWMESPNTGKFDQLDGLCTWDFMKVSQLGIKWLDQFYMKIGLVINFKQIWPKRYTWDFMQNFLKQALNIFTWKLDKWLIWPKGKAINLGFYAKISNMSMKFFSIEIGWPIKFKKIWSKEGLCTWDFMLKSPNGALKFFTRKLVKSLNSSKLAKKKEYALGILCKNFPSNHCRFSSGNWKNHQLQAIATKRKANTLGIHLL